MEATPARTYDEVAATKTMLDRTDICFGLKPKRLAADTAYGTGKFLGWLVKDKTITPHIPVWEKSDREDGIFSARTSDGTNDAECTSARMASYSGPVAPCTTDALDSIVPRNATATSARCDPNAAPGRKRARSRAICTKTLAM